MVTYISLWSRDQNLPSMGRKDSWCWPRVLNLQMGNKSNYQTQALEYKGKSYRHLSAFPLKSQRGLKMPTHYRGIDEVTPLSTPGLSQA